MPKGERPCGPSCQCIGCTNIPEVQAAPDDLQEMEVQDRQQQDNQIVDDSDSELDLLQEDQEEVTVLLMS